MPIDTCYTTRGGSKAPERLNFAPTLTCHSHARWQAAELEQRDLRVFFRKHETSVVYSDANLQAFMASFNEWLDLRGEMLRELRMYRHAYERALLVDHLTAPLVVLFESVWDASVLHHSYQNDFGAFVNLIISDMSGDEEVPA